MHIVKTFDQDIEDLNQDVEALKTFNEPLRKHRGRLWIFDDTRDKWLSTDTSIIIAGRNGRVNNSYLKVVDGQASNLSGYRLPRDATIISLSAQTTNPETWTLRVRKNKIHNEIASLSLVNIEGDHDTGLDIDVEEGDVLQFFADTIAFWGIENPLVWAEIAWRNDSF